MSFSVLDENSFSTSVSPIKRGADWTCNLVWRILVHFCRQCGLVYAFVLLGYPDWLHTRILVYKERVGSFVEAVFVVYRHVNVQRIACGNTTD